MQKRVLDEVKASLKFDDYDRVLKALRQYTRGATARQIADYTHIPIERVEQLLRKANVIGDTQPIGKLWFIEGRKNMEKDGGVS